MKPLIYVANVDDTKPKSNSYLHTVQAIAEKEQTISVAVCAKIESEIAKLEVDEKLEFMAEMGLTAPGLNQIVWAGYRSLNLHTYFTAGAKEVRAWVVPVGATAAKAAGVIHTDFERGFIRADVVSYDDFIQYRGEPGIKKAGKWRQEGREYQVADGDVIHFLFNV